MMNSKKVLCIALVLILIGSIGAMVLQTDFGNVTVRDLYILTEDQQYLHALAFVPDSATAETPAPAVVTLHGWLNSAEVQDAACIELSRRGVVVIAIDGYNHGLSSSVQETQSLDGKRSGQGIVPVVEYCASGVLNFIDADRIGIMGHSMGSWAIANVFRYYDAIYLAALEEAKMPESDGGEEITEAEQAYADSLYKVSAALPTAQMPNIHSWETVRCNIGVLYTQYDEAGYGSSTGTANLLPDSTEVLDMMHSVDPAVTSVENGKYYGSIEDGTLRVYYQPKTTHPLLHFSPACTEVVISFFTDVFGLETDLAPSNQTFMIKEIFNFIAMIGLFMMLVPVCALLLEVPCFASLKGKEGPKLPALAGASKKRFWLGWVLGAVVSFLAALLAVLLIPTRGSPVHGYSQENWLFFAAPTMNAIGVWTFLSAIWGGIWFYRNYKKDMAAGLTSDEIVGLKISGKEFWKSVGMAATVIGFIYAVVWFCKWAFNTDFRLWTPAVKTFNVEKLFYFIQYLPFFFAFYFVNSLSVNGAGRFEGMSENKNLLIHAVGNVLGSVTLWGAHYGKLFLTGTVLWTDGWITVLAFGFCIWQLFLAPFLLRKFYRLTGKNWVGPLIVSSMYVLMGVANTALHSTII